MDSSGGFWSSLFLGSLVILFMGGVVYVSLAIMQRMLDSKMGKGKGKEGKEPRNVGEIDGKVETKGKGGL